jgi:hypothetical protein
MQTLKRPGMMTIGTTARHVMSIAALFFVVASATAKDKPRVTIQVIDTQASSREYTYYIPGTNSHSNTNCSGNATTIDLGGGIATANITTDCTTTTTPGSPATTGVGYIPQANVHAIMPNGTHVTLWCQRGFRRYPIFVTVRVGSSLSASESG